VQGTKQRKYTYKHYIRGILEDKLASTLKEGYISKPAILTPLQCPAKHKVGFGGTFAENKSDTGNLLEAVFYPFLKGESRICINTQQLI
jgi:hypothetical protein